MSENRECKKITSRYCQNVAVGTTLEAADHEVFAYLNFHMKITLIMNDNDLLTRCKSSR